MVTPSSLLDMLSQLRAQRKVAADEVARIEADINAVERTLALYEDWQSAGVGNAAGRRPAEYRAEEYAGLSQVEAIKALAKSKNGVVRIADAKRMLVETGLTKSQKPYSIATSIILRRPDLFEYVGPGTYRLVTNPNPNGHQQAQPLLIESAR